MLRVAGSSQPASREGGIKQAATAWPRNNRAPIESTSQSVATVKHVVTDARAGVATVLRIGGDLRTTGHYAMYPLTSLQAGGVLFPTTSCRYGLPVVGPIGQ